MIYNRGLVTGNVRWIISENLERIVQIGLCSIAHDNLSRIGRDARNLNFRATSIGNAFRLLNDGRVPSVILENIGIDAGFANLADATNFNPRQGFEARTHKVNFLICRANI
mgnify:CR=1 FL=1